jgi:predicted ribosomally synthesized peptide with nif11-like leader
MSTPAEQLLKKMVEDKSFAETILKQNEIEKVIELAKEEEIALTQEDIDEANAVIQKAVELQANSEGELTEEELENVAGGIVLEITLLAGLSLLLLSLTATATASVSYAITEAGFKNC